MDTKNFTIKSQEAIQKAQELTLSGQQQAIETGHLLKGIFIVDEDVISYALKKVNANIQRIHQALESVIQSYPKVSGGGNPYLSSKSQQVLINANTYLTEFGDEFVTIEHIFIALLQGNDQISNLLKDAGVKQAEIIK